MENNAQIIEYLQAKVRDEQHVLAILKSLNGDRRNFEIKKFIVAKRDEDIVGCIRTKVFKDGTLELASLAVLPEYQNSGIGSELVRKLLLFEKNRPIFLLTTLDKEAFYKKFNFYLIDINQLPNEFRDEYLRIKCLPFAKNVQVIAMKI